MRWPTFIIFFSVFLLIYGIVNYYIFIRGWHALPRHSALRAFYTALFLIVSLSYIFGRVLERYTVCAISDCAIWLGSFWLGYMLYLFLGAALVDMLRAVIHIFNVHLPFIHQRYEAAKMAAAAAVFGAATLIVAAGFVNACTPRIRELRLNISGKATSLASLHLVLVTDIHLGTLIGNSRLLRLVKSINDLKPDCVLLAGDIVDEDLKPVIEQNIGETLCNIESRHGVYAVTGNHEYIGGADEAVSYLERHGVRMLRDAAVLVAGQFYIAGREDRSVEGFTGRRRVPLERILATVDTRRPVVLMDHQPFRLHEVTGNGVDLQVSGHTHHGQLWPFNFITRMVYEVSMGHKKNGKTHYYVSCGWGTWGPPVRTNSRPEIVSIQINFTH